MQSVAPKSISAWLVSRGRTESSKASLSTKTRRRRGRRTPWAVKRAKTLLTFPSRIGNGALKAGRMLPAVVRPMPGNAVHSANVRGQGPPTSSCDASCNRRAREYTPSPATAAVPHRETPRLVPRQWRTLPSNAPTREYHGQLGLLQHDLSNPDAVRVELLLWRWRDTTRQQFQGILYGHGTPTRPTRLSTEPLRRFLSPRRFVRHWSQHDSDNKRPSTRFARQDAPAQQS